MIKALGYTAKHSYSRLKRLEFEREEARANEIEMEVLYCGDAMRVFRIEL